MKSFSQFLEESYLYEADAQQLRLMQRDNKSTYDFQKNPGNKGIAADPINHVPNSPLPEKPQGPVSHLAGAKPSPPSPGQSSIPGMNFGRPGDESRNQAEIARRKAAERASNPKPPAPSSGSGGKPPAPSGGGGGAPSGGGAGGGKPPSGPKLKVPAGAGRALRVAGRLVGPAAAALDVADERSKGSGWLRSGLKAATVAAGGALGGAAGSVAGPVGSFAGAAGGAMAASNAFDTAAGANAVQRKAMATANRRSQSGSSLAGIGGKTTFDTKKNTMTTGSGSQQKTVKLGKTSVVTGPGGKQETGYLAYKGGKAVYKRAQSPQSLAQTSSNPLERIGRSLFAGAYKQSDAAAAAKKLSTARQSDVKRNQQLGVKLKPGG